jgi:hypothetical protein
MSGTALAFRDRTKIPSSIKESPMTRYLLGLVVMFVPAVAWSQEAKPGKRAADIELAVVKALEAANMDQLGKVLTEIRALSEKERRALPVRIYGDVVELQFRGRFPGKDLSLDMMEYVVGVEGKAYETLLIVDDKEMDRLNRFGVALETFSSKTFGKKQKLPPFQVKLAWVEGGVARVEDLRDIVSTESAEKRAKFLKGLYFDSYGFREENVKGDPARVPGRAGPAMVTIAVRLPQAVPE